MSLSTKFWNRDVTADTTIQPQEIDNNSSSCGQQLVCRSSKSPYESQQLLNVSAMLSMMSSKISFGLLLYGLCKNQILVIDNLSTIKHDF